MFLVSPSARAPRSWSRPPRQRLPRAESAHALAECPDGAKAVEPRLFECVELQIAETVDVVADALAERHVARADVPAQNLAHLGGAGVLRRRTHDRRGHAPEIEQ